MSKRQHHSRSFQRRPRPRNDYEMNTHKYYAVARGENPGLYYNWDDAKEIGLGGLSFPWIGCKHKAFNSKKEALEFLHRYKEVVLRTITDDELIHRRPRQIDASTQTGLGKETSRRIQFDSDTSTDSESEYHM